MLMGANMRARDRPMLSIRYVFVLIFPTDDRYGQSSLNMVLFSYSLYRHHSFHRTLSSDKFISMCIESVSFNKHITASYHTILLISFHFFGTLLSCVMIFFHLRFWIYFMLLKIHAKMCVCYRSVRGRCDYKCWGMCVGVREITKPALSISLYGDVSVHYGIRIIFC